MAKSMISAVTITAVELVKKPGKAATDRTSAVPPEIETVMPGKIVQLSQEDFDALEAMGAVKAAPPQKAEKAAKVDQPPPADQQQPPAHQQQPPADADDADDDGTGPTGVDLV